MNTFELNKDALRLAWNSANQYWFSLKDYKIKNVTTLAQMDIPENMNESSYFVSLGYIPYVNVSDIEVMRAYVETISNKKLKDALSKISSEDYVESFWKYLNIYPELDGYKDFEDAYVLDKLKNWCEENAIKYIL